MKCPNCGRDLRRYPALYPNQQCPTTMEAILDRLGFPTRWEEYRERLRRNG
jgi:hypothetical protein